MTEQLEARLREQAKFYGNPDLLIAAAEVLAALREDRDALLLRQPATPASAPEEASDG